MEFKQAQDQTLKEFERKSNDDLVNRIAMENFRMAQAKYTDLKSYEGIVTLIMIILLAGSVIVVLLTSMIDVFPPFVKDNHGLISVFTFSTMLQLVILQLYLPLTGLAVFLHTLGLFQNIGLLCSVSLLPP